MLKLKPRLYQEKILATAVKGNTLVVLPTGLGKTLIAIMLGLIRQKFGKVVFLAPTRPLVEQHARSIEEITGIRALVLHGKMKPEERLRAWENAKWIVATPQALQNDLLRGLSLADVSLLVFDEAHRATGDYAYVFIAKKYMEQAKNAHILALTASPGADEERIREIVRNLFIQFIEVRTGFEPDVRPYIASKQLQWVEVELPVEYKLVVDQIKRILKEYLLILRELGYISSASVSKIKLRELIELQSKIGEDPLALSSVAAAIKAWHALNLVETQGMKAYARFLERLRQDRSKAGRELYSKLPKPIEARHPKLDKLLEVIQSREGQVIVFAQFRDQVEEIVKFLNEHGISARKFIGQREGMSQKQQKLVIEAFRSGAFRVLVATSVAEEGLDIPSVETVIFYEPVPSEIRHIQRKGRLRKGGKIFVLITKGSREENILRAARFKELRMARLLKEIAKKVEPKVRVQATLASFEEGAFRIIADYREAGIAKLIGASLARLEVGDFVISDRIVVERKKASDFLASIIDGRLFEQVREMKKAYELPVIVIEGERLLGHRNIHPNAVFGALASLIADWGVSVVFTRNEEETARFLLALAKREANEGRAPAIKTAKARSLKENQELLVASLPGVNLTLAKRLLKKFGSPIDVFIASEERLKLVEGIGELKAREIRKVLDTQYREEEA